MSRKVFAQIGRLVDIGIAGEDKAVKVVIPIPKDWEATNDNVALFFKAPHRFSAVPYDVDVKEDLVEWLVPQSATIVGTGKIQLCLVEEDITQKTIEFSSMCHKSIDDHVPPKPHSNWLTKILNIVKKYEDNTLYTAGENVEIDSEHRISATGGGSEPDSYIKSITKSIVNAAKAFITWKDKNNIEEKFGFSAGNNINFEEEDGLVKINSTASGDLSEYRKAAEQDDIDDAIRDSVDDLDEDKVSKEAGKGLSTEDFTTQFKEKVEGLPADTSSLVSDSSYVHTDNNFTDDEKDKLSDIEEGAQKNVQSDWDETDNTKDEFIKNKPPIPSKTSDLTNDSDFVSDSSYVHSDNNFSDIEKQKISDNESAILTLDSNKQDKTDDGLETASKVIVSAINGLNTLLIQLQNDKQNKTDNTLMTSAKNIIDAINEIFTIAGKAFHFKGTVSTVADLPEGASEGDVYGVSNPNPKTYAFNGTDWHDLGGTFDLSGYRTADAQDLIDATKQAVLVAGDNITIEHLGDGTDKISAILEDLSDYRKAADQDTIDNEIKADIEALENGKVDKTDVANQLYGTNSSSAQATHTVDFDKNPSTVPKRGTSGQVRVGDPTNNYDAVNLKTMNSAIETLDNDKVDKEDGKGLSSNDYTNADKQKVDNLPTNTENVVTDADYVHSDNNYTDNDKDKLDGIAEGAEVNVQSDWNETDSSADSFIKNKPEIDDKVDKLKNANKVYTTNGTGADSSKAYALTPTAGAFPLYTSNKNLQTKAPVEDDDAVNKKTFEEALEDKQNKLVAGANITIDEETNTISASGGGGSYTAGTGIDITDDVISIKTMTEEDIDDIFED